MEGQYPIMDWKNLPFNTEVWKESERLAGKEGYKHPVRVVYNPKTMTYRTILNKSKFQVIDKKDLEFYKEAEKTDKSIKVCEVNEEDFLYLNFDANPKPTEEELMQMLEKARKEMSGLEKEKYNSEVQLTEDSQFNENIVNVPNFGTQEEETKAVEEILSGPAPKTGEESRILVFSVLLGMSVTVMGGTIYRIKMKKGANGTL